MRPAPAGEIPVIKLPDRLRLAREHAQLSRAQMARLLQVHPNSVNNYETGRRSPSHPTVIAWAQICGVDLTWLAGETSDPNFRPGGHDRYSRLTPLQGIAAAGMLAGGILSQLPGAS